MIDKELLEELIGLRVSSHRKRKKKTQEALADLVGINRTSIVNIENGRHLPSLPVLYSIADVLNVDVGDLLPGTNEIQISDKVERVLRSTSYLNQEQKNSVLQALKKDNINE